MSRLPSYLRLDKPCHGEENYGLTWPNQSPVPRVGDTLKTLFYLAENKYL